MPLSATNAASPVDVRSPSSADEANTPTPAPERNAVRPEIEPTWPMGPTKGVRNGQDPTGPTQAIEVGRTGPEDRFTEHGEVLQRKPPAGATIQRNPKYVPWNGEPPPHGSGWYERWSINGRWAYNYTVAYRDAKSGLKFQENRHFAAVIGAIRARYGRDLKEGDPERQTKALIVALIDQCCFRIGGTGSLEEARPEEKRHGDADDGYDYGITTLKRKHVHFESSDGEQLAVFPYFGKDGQSQEKVAACTPFMYALLKDLRDNCATQEDFLFRVDGTRINDDNIRAYLSDFGVHPHQFRHFHATAMVLQELLQRVDLPAAERETAITEALTVAQELLGHKSMDTTVDYYVDPEVLAAYRAGELEQYAKDRQKDVASRKKDLSPD